MRRSFRASAVGSGFLSLIALAFTASAAPDDKDKAKPGPLEGAWRLVTYQNGDAAEPRKLPEGFEQIKLVTGGRFVWTLVQDGRVTAGAGGKYTVEGDRYVEHVDFVVGEDLKSFVGNDHPFTWKIEDGKWHHTGVTKSDQGDYKIDEVWERCR
jgi:hypothetical protein